MSDAGEDLSWIPDRCPAGHPLGPGRLTLSYDRHPCGHGLTGHGHHVAYCKACPHPEQLLPPGCTLATGTSTAI